MDPAPPEFVSDAFAVPAARSPPLVAVTVIVRVWFVPTAFLALCGVIWMKASTQFLPALAQLLVQPAVTFVAVPVVRDTDPLALVKLMLDDADTSVWPATAEVMTTTQDAVAAPPA